MNALPPLPNELRFINSYLQKGQELQTREPVIAYYCNYYAAKLAISKGSKTKESKVFLATLLDVLEAEKKGLNEHEAISNDMAGSAYVENFGLKIFLNADNEDRAGKATKKTAKNFLVASMFLELLKIFGEIETEIEEKIKYAKWKAANIVKAINSGQTPVPGPPGGEPEQTILGGGGDQIQNETPNFDQFPSAPLSSSTVLPVISSPTTLDNNTNNANNVPDPWSIFPSPPTQESNIINNINNHQQPPVSTQHFDATSATIHNNHGQPTNTDPERIRAPPLPPKNISSHVAVAPPSQQQLTQIPLEIDADTIAIVQKHSKWAISALNYNDIKTAIENLQKAVVLLEPYNK
ncbi:3170_t:CDS:2 [Ambispora gerdemannii]|uniref:3170_t:CDS:1 n=1 Tax=Ambispora gerdemannii TaxID=144530 RepID=A0A9N9AJI0_9GLOM|nr:3170_t:CDS:2 [Ambispora gerdemannii]